MEKHQRATLTALAAGYKARKEKHRNRRYLVVPVVALVEGVVHAANSRTAEFVPGDELKDLGWNGRPIFVGHPQEGSRFVSGNTPERIERDAVGTVFGTAVRGKKLTMEAWLDEDKLGEVDPDMLARISEGKPVEISVGVYVDTDGETGVYEGKAYIGRWYNLMPDHLALLPGDDVGACSLEMGCGVRAATKQRDLIIRKKGDKWCLSSKDGKKNLGCFDTREQAEKREREVQFFKHRRNAMRGKGLFATLLDALRAGRHEEGEYYNSDVQRLLNEALQERHPGMHVWVTDWSDTEVIFSLADPEMMAPPAWFRHGYVLEEGKITLSEKMVEVEPVMRYEDVTAAGEGGKKTYANLTAEENEGVQAFLAKNPLIPRSLVERVCAPCADKMRSLNITQIRASQIPPGLLDGLCEKFGPAEGFRTRCMESSLGDFDPADQAAFCNFLKGECGLTGTSEHQQQRGATMITKERVKALIAKATGWFKAEDEKFLEGLTEEQFKAFETRADEQVTAAQAKADANAAKADANAAKADADAAKAVGQPEAPTFESLLKAAPADVREAIEQGQRAAKERKAATIQQLRDSKRCDLTDEQLNAKSQAELDALVKLMGAVMTVDFSGQAPRTPGQGEQKDAPSAPDLVAAVKAKQGIK
jgi:hypothetical protein